MNTVNTDAERTESHGEIKIRVDIQDTVEDWQSGNRSNVQIKEQLNQGT